MSSPRLKREAPVTKVSWVKSTSSRRDSVLVVEPQRMSILLSDRAVKRSAAVTGTYSTPSSEAPSSVFTAFAMRWQRSME